MRSRTPLEALARLTDAAEQHQDCVQRVGVRDLRGALLSARNTLVANGFIYCRKCGCSENDACPGGCSWVAADLCSCCGDVFGLPHLDHAGGPR